MKSNGKKKASLITVYWAEDDGPQILVVFPDKRQLAREGQMAENLRRRIEKDGKRDGAHNHDIQGKWNWMEWYRELPDFDTAEKMEEAFPASFGLRRV